MPITTHHLLGFLDVETVSEIQRQNLPLLEKLANHARLVWEEDDDAREFLRSPQPMLDGRSPLEIALSGEDIHPVEALLNRLEYSLPV